MLNYKTYHIITYGCQMNENDSEKIAGMLEKLNYTSVDEPESAQLIIMNTCSVRENADDRFFGNLGNFKKLKNATIAVCGCMMQQEKIVETIIKKYPFVDIIFGTHNIEAFPILLNQFNQSGQMVCSVLKDTANIPEIVEIKHRYSHKAFVSITFGCDNFCSYCIVPFTRGREKSRSSALIIEEISRLADSGCKEIMLLGQNVNSYNKKGEDDISFAQLLTEVNKVEGIERIRFMTSHPKDFTYDIIKAIKENDKVCPNVHLPIQSGSDRILKEMNRKYDMAHYFGLVERLRSEIPEITLSTDIIVGFPNETDEDFEKTLYAVEKCRFDSAFTFIYSPREGTKAAKIENTLTHEVIHERFDSLLKLQYSIMDEKAETYRDKVEQVMIDGTSRGDKKMLTGRTKDNHLVNFEGEGLVGQIVNVLITNPTTFYLGGKII